jgi:hypothetical protein
MVISIVAYLALHNYYFLLHCINEASSNNASDGAVCEWAPQYLMQMVKVILLSITVAKLLNILQLMFDADVRGLCF